MSANDVVHDDNDDDDDDDDDDDGDGDGGDDYDTNETIAMTNDIHADE